MAHVGRYGAGAGAAAEAQGRQKLVLEMQQWGVMRVGTGDGMMAATTGRLERLNLQLAATGLGLADALDLAH